MTPTKHERTNARSTNAQAVKELRDKTNAGMMDCKKALEQAGGNMEQAIDILRKRGLAVAQQKSGRLAHEGILGLYCNEKVACLVEVNCETDFVVRTDDFQNFVAKTTQLVYHKSPKDLTALLNTPCEGKGTVQETLTALIAKIGENIQVRRFVRWEAGSPEEKMGFYLHAGSKIAVLVLIHDANSKMGPDAAKEVAMHVAAMNPRYVRQEEVPAPVLEKEREIQRAGVDPKKPIEIQNKIVEGKLKKFFSEVCLEEQVFVKDLEGKTTVGDWLKKQSPTAKIEKFVRLQVGT